MSLRVLSLLCLSILLALPVAAQYDLLIRGGRLIDGTGQPWRYADVAVTAGRVVAVGPLDGATARRTLDATGLLVAPGFIDTHSHAGPGLATPGLSDGRPLIAQGITTVVVNPDGGGPTDLGAQRAALLADGLGVNVAQMVPHGSVRSAVMGAAARAPTPAEQAEMASLVSAGMTAGAFGLSSGLFYAPGSFAETQEVVVLARVAADQGGVYASHIRDESTYSVGLVAAVEEVITVAREADLPGIVTHIKALGPPVWGFSGAIIQRVEAARAEGVEVWADQYPYPASATNLSAALFPRWAQAGGADAFQARLADPGLQDSLRAAVAANLARRGGADRLQIRFHAPDTALEGQTLQAIADARAQDPLDLVFALVQAGSTGVVSFNMHDDDVAAFMRQPWTMVASDGSLVPLGRGVPHPRGYGTFPRMLRHYSLGQRLMPLEAAIGRMTGLPAAVYRMAGRGQLQLGAPADVVVFDPDRLRDTATFTQPHQYAEGMVYVLVNGTLVIDDGAFTGERPGRVLHRHTDR